MTKTERETELLDMPWQAIKSIAEPLGIAKPEGGWDEAIPLILEAEFPKVKPSKPVKASPKPATTDFLYSSDFFESSGIPYCKDCGASYQNDLEGNPVCPVSKTDCSRLEN